MNHNIGIIFPAGLGSRGQLDTRRGILDAFAEIGKVGKLEEFRRNRS